MVIDEALKQAELLAEKPKDSLKLLRAHLSQHLKATMPTIIEQELAMHKETFSKPETKARIEPLFGQ